MAGRVEFRQPVVLRDVTSGPDALTAKGCDDTQVNIERARLSPVSCQADARPGADSIQSLNPREVSPHALDRQPTG
jgi:hypothetical protein